MDLEYLQAHPETIDQLLAHQRIRTTTVHDGPLCLAERLTLDDGTDLFTKSRRGAPADFFAVEAASLQWLAAAAAVPLPEVIAVTKQRIVLEWVPPGSATAQAAEEFGRGLARLHLAGADEFGAPWQGFIGSLPLDNRPCPTWPEFYVERRCRPYLKQAVDAGALEPTEAVVIDQALARLPELAGAAEPPARLHGDLWSGNVHFGADGQAWLIDPAAHGGHRETDLACLALFGAPYLERIIAAYHEVYPLAAGWQQRRGLHQLHLLLVHCVLFGRKYVPPTLGAARTVE